MIPHKEFAKKLSSNGQSHPTQSNQTFQNLHGYILRITSSICFISPEWKPGKFRLCRNLEMKELHIFVGAEVIQLPRRQLLVGWSAQSCNGITHSRSIWISLMPVPRNWYGSMDMGLPRNWPIYYVPVLNLSVYFYIILILYHIYIILTM